MVAEVSDAEARPWRSFSNTCFNDAAVNNLLNATLYSILGKKGVFERLLI